MIFQCACQDFPYSKIGGVEGASFNAWRVCGDSLEKGKGEVWGEELPRKRKIPSLFLYCS